MRYGHRLALSLLLLGACAVEPEFEPAAQHPTPLAIDYGFNGPDSLGETVVPRDAPPPPISGGTLAALGAHMVVAADPDRDAVYIVDLATRSVATVALEIGDEPGRVAIDPRGLAHVALRRAGAIVSIDTVTARVRMRRAVCAAPRGIAYDAAQDALVVACVGGELVAVPALGGESRTIARVDGGDLRDVVVTPDELLVSRFRTPELVHVTRDGTVGRRERPDGTTSKREPAIAWRTIPLPGGGAAMVHHLARVEIPPPPPRSGGNYYGPPPPPPVASLGEDTGAGDGCDAAVVDYALSIFPATAPPLRMVRAVLPVDVAVSPDGHSFSVVAAGNAYNSGFHSLYTVGASDPGPCAALVPRTIPYGEATAVTYAGDDLVVQLREPAVLQLVGKGITIPLSASSRKDTGHLLFHANTGRLIACASCHPEGGDDGRVWKLTEGALRTPSLRGTLAGTAPYHWGGELRSLPDLFTTVMVGRMGAKAPNDGQVSALSGWLQHLAPPRALGTAPDDARARGQRLFEDPVVGCAGCHAGAHFTSNMTVDVGTGRALQVPSLVGVAWRAPYLHDGCAATLLDRFTCGGARHGDVSQLTSADLADLVAYLEIL